MTTYKVYAEHYYNDRNRTDHVLTFANLEDDFKRWMDEHYGGGYGAIPCSKYRDSEKWWPHRIDLGRMSDGGSWWVHQIESHRGIEFTDDSLTNDKRHISKLVLAVLDAYVDEKSNPESKFVD